MPVTPGAAKDTLRPCLFTEADNAYNDLKWCPKSGAVIVPQQHQAGDVCVELSSCGVRQVTAFQGNTNPVYQG